MKEYCEKLNKRKMRHKVSKGHLTNKGHKVHKGYKGHKVHLLNRKQRRLLYKQHRLKKVVNEHIANFAKVSTANNITFV